MARCVSVTFKQRQYNQNGNNQPDQTLDKGYYYNLKSVCPKSGGDNNISPLDFASPEKFDNTYFKLIPWGKGLLTSDEVLFTGSAGTTMQLVKRYAEDESLFFDQLAKSMVKMGNISPLTGFKGEVRKNCRRVDWATNYLLKTVKTVWFIMLLYFVDWHLILVKLCDVWLLFVM